MTDQELKQLSKTDTQHYLSVVIANEKKLRAVGAPWLNPNGKRYIPTVDEKLRYEYLAGIKTLRECAIEFCRAGWTNFVDMQYTERKVKSVINGINTEDMCKQVNMLGNSTFVY